MSKSETQFRLTLGVEYEKKSAKEKYSCIPILLDDILKEKGLKP